MPPTARTRAKAAERQVADKYLSDSAYRLSVGPNIEKWCAHELDESLIGLQFSLPFAVGECRGTVSGIKENNNRREGKRADGKWHAASRWTVTWTCAPDHDEKFESVMEEEALLGCYYRGKERPDHVADEKYARRLGGVLFAPLPAGAQMVNFQLPGDTEWSWPWLEGERQNRWWVTLSRLNDPACAALYAPGHKSYPLPLLFAIMKLQHEEDPGFGVKFPTVVHPQKKVVYDICDKFSRRLSSGEDRERCGHGYGQLRALETLVGEVAAMTPPPGYVTSEAIWQRAYMHVEALVLTLSHAHENAHDDWLFADDSGRITSVCASIVAAVGEVLLRAPSVKTRSLVASDASHLAHHLKSGSFADTITCDDDFEAECPQAARTWKELCALGQNAGAAETNACTDSAASHSTKRKRAAPKPAGKRRARK